MGALFKTTNKYTFEEYKKFNMALLKKKMIITTIILEVILLMLADMAESFFIVIMAVIYPIILLLIQSENVKRVYESNKIMQNIDVEFEFYENYFSIKYKNGEAKVEYNMLSEVIETKSNFYLMIAKNQGYMLLKSNMNDEFLEFVHSKLMKIHH